MQIQPGYTPSEVAAMLGVKQSTVYAWLSRKELIGYKLGQSRYITKQQLQALHEKRVKGECINVTYANGPIRSYQI
jgi:excisionase family DNA binding protein